MKVIKCIIFSLVILAIGCTKDPVVINNQDTLGETTLKGFNMRWRNTPKLSEKLFTYVDSLKPDLMRYPGGTMAHKWNWKEGVASPSNSNDIVHKIENVKLFADGVNSNIIFVLDVVNSTLENQLEMLQQANVPVKYIELGNELYSDHYETEFPNGKAYADTVNAWTPTLRAHFPNAKIGAVMLGRNAGNDRKANWNTNVYNNILAEVDAFIYHIYVTETETVQERVERFLPTFIENTGKELWITEYGAHSHNLNQLNELANYIESIADVALSHCLISGSGNFSKITPEIEYTPEGLEYLKRNNPLVN